MQQDLRDSAGTYFPYGEDRGSLPSDAVKFASYTRDSISGLDYGVNRYYTADAGRFSSPDPYSASGAPSNPASGNRYSNVLGDPVNLFDPSGRMALAPGSSGGGIFCDGDTTIDCWGGDAQGGSAQWAGLGCGSHFSPVGPFFCTVPLLAAVPPPTPTIACTITLSTRNLDAAPSSGFQHLVLWVNIPGVTSDYIEGHKVTTPTGTYLNSWVNSLQQPTLQPLTRLWSDTNTADCLFAAGLLSWASTYQNNNVPYNPLVLNSNSFAYTSLAESGTIGIIPWQVFLYITLSIFYPGWGATVPHN